MSYKVLIKVGKSQMGSTPLKTKGDVVRWVKQNPMGNYKTNVVVTDTETKKMVSGWKVKFKRLGNW
jgi:hypothetical protein